MPDSHGSVFAQFAKASNSKEDSASTSQSSKPLPKGVVLGKDGKPCRTCTSSADWLAMMRASPKPGASKKSPLAAGAAATPATPSDSDCPPDVEELGRSTWTLLHSLAASYPAAAPPETQSMTGQFLSLFSKLYPCWVCAEDFRDWMVRPENEPKLKGREEFGVWMCQAHNAVNVKLGKKEFDCNLWKQRWKDGWDDGSCD